MDVAIEFYSPTIVRVDKTPDNSKAEKNSLAVIMKSENVNVRQSVSNGNVVLASYSLDVVVNKSTRGIVFKDKRGSVLLRDKDHGTQFSDFNDAGTPSYNVRQAFLLDKDEVIYGLGQQQTGKVNQRNQKLHICIPFIHSVKGYGLYWDNYSPTTFNDNRQEMSFDSEVGDCADYFFSFICSDLYLKFKYPINS